MNFKYTICVVLVLCRNLPAIEGVQNTENTFKMTDRVYTCSKWLAAVIDNFCNNVYKIVKRDTSLMLDKLTPDDLLNNRNKRRKLTEMSWRRVRRQVASECCEKPCTVENIIMYCPDDAKVLIENPDLFNYKK